MTIRRRIYQIMEAGHPEDVVSQIFDWAVICLIVGNVVAAVVSTLPGLAGALGGRVFHLRSCIGRDLHG